MNARRLIVSRRRARAIVTAKNGRPKVFSWTQRSVRTGSIATEMSFPWHVRFPPVNDQRTDIAGGPVRAQSQPLTTCYRNELRSNLAQTDLPPARDAIVDREYLARAVSSNEFVQGFR